MDPNKRIALRSVVASAVVAGLVGIGAVVNPGVNDQLARNVGLSALTIGAASLVALCLLSPRGTAGTRLAAAGALASVIATATTLFVIWDEYGNDSRYTVLWASLVAALSIAQACLIVAAVEQSADQPLGAAVALLLITAVAALLILLVTETIAETDATDKTLGTLAILDALATMWVWAERLMRGARDRHVTSLERSTQTRLAAAAAARGVSPSVLVDRALDAYLDASAAGDRA